MPKPTSPDLEKFKTDPEFAGDRALFEGYLEHVLTTRAAEVKTRHDKGEKGTGIFDALFGGLFGGSVDDDVNIFDAPFLGRRK